MINKINNIDLLPDEMIGEIKDFLAFHKHPITSLENERDQSNFALSCHRFYQCAQDERLLSKLGNFVIAGNQDKAQKILQIRPDLVAKRGLISDWSGRVFYCSPFEYALWALDVKYMCPMMLGCLPRNKTGEVLKRQLLEQAQAVGENGLCYKLDDQVYQEKYFSLELLKNVLKIYIEGFAIWSLSKQEEYWCTVIGKVQLLLPAHIRQHYCDPEESFYDEPTFMKPKFTRSLKFRNWVGAELDDLWDGNLTRLGVDFAIGCDTYQVSATFKRDCTDVQNDLEAITLLNDVRIGIDLPLLMKRLDTPLKKTRKAGCVIS